jgi:hypothetical protein
MPAWAWLSLIPFGLGSWAPLYAGVREHQPRWCAAGALWSAATVAGWIVAAADSGSTLAGLLILLGWGGGIASSCSIANGTRDRPAIDPIGALTADPGWNAALQAAEERMSERDRALHLAIERPALAREMGIGRPDIPGSRHAGLVDVNTAPAAVIATLPDIGPRLADAIVQARAATHGFSSVEDLGVALNLDGALVEQLRGRVVLLPG